MRRVCPTCGKTFIFDENLSPNRRFCDKACQVKHICRHAATGAKKRRQDYTEVTIQITQALNIFPELCPTVGRKYKAEKYCDRNGTGYVIMTKKRINVRADECREVSV